MRTPTGYADEIASRLPASMHLPDEIRALFDRMETSGHFMASSAYPDDRLGLLGSEHDLQSDRVTPVLFRVDTPDQAREFGEAWFGSGVPGVEGRIIPFARTGGDGWQAAFWLDDEGCPRIVHLGSEGLACLLGWTPLDFLRLLALGYDEISGDCIDTPDEPPATAGRNAGFRSWVVERYGVTIPETAAAILGPIPDVLVDSSDDLFWRWVREKQDLRDAEPTAS